MDEKQAYVPLKNSEKMENNEENFRGHGCGCFWQLCFSRRRNNSDNPNWAMQKQQKGEIKESWLKKKAKKMKEISEVLAGPKLKNFIGGFGINGIINKKKRRSQFYYDPRSYVLNFDGGDRGESGGSVSGDSFAARFAAPQPPGAGGALFVTTALWF